MTGIVFFTKNAIGGFTPIEVMEFSSYDIALLFYMRHKATYRKRDVYLKLVVEEETKPMSFLQGRKLDEEINKEDM